MARVSISMPTYNRGDVIRRAIDSILAQTYQDWELVVVDDGSTDGTRDLLAGLDPRIRVVVQENQGITGARNTGLRHGRCELVAFLDSDDAWPPHHLALATAFFDAHPGEHFYTSEFWEDFGVGDQMKHYRVETGDWYPATARRIGSRAFQGPPPQGDPYLWFYQERRPVGPWASGVLATTPYREVFHYTGHLFPMWRWGWLLAMQPTVITRHAAEVVGPFDARYRIASDFGFLATLCQRFRANFLNLPGGIKHEFGEGQRPMSEGHLVTGRTAVQFHQEVLGFLEELYWRKAPQDPELAALRAFRQYLVGRTALLKGERELALRYLEQAAQAYGGADVTAALWLARLVGSGSLSSALYRAWLKVQALPDRLRHRLARLAGTA
jgi:glycosyltransferase involved in cell wall biosynthesis